MRAIGIKMLKNKLSEYIRLVASTGETVLITDRDRVVAELSPPSPQRAGVLNDALLAEVVRKGWLTPPLEVGPPPAPPKTDASLDDVLADLSSDRDAR